VFIYHYSIGWDFGLRMLRELPGKRVVKYHNITPPEFFENVNDGYAAVCRAGRAQIKDVAKANCDLFLSDSKYNGDELIAEGADPSRSAVVPPFHHVDRLHSLEADLSLLDTVRNGPVNVLTVGRLAPNKGHPALIDAFAIYHRHYNRNSRLVVVGKEDNRLGPYTEALYRQVVDRGLTDSVVFTGEASDKLLKTYYLAADVFVSTSRHEGFCVPVVEAMAMKVPVVALGTTAVPETVGDAGLVWHESDPELLAASIHRVADEEPVRLGLGELGWRRYRKRFANDRIKETFLKTMNALL
jgi:glycosyltransferase involved in cell wall biosynthesis